MILEIIDFINLITIRKISVHSVKGLTMRAITFKHFGTAAEFIALPQNQAVPLPDPVDLEIGAVLGIPALTACHAVLGGGTEEGKTVLVSGGAGTVVRLAVQTAAASGA